VWTAVDRNRLCFSAFEVGDGSSGTFEKLWRKLEQHTIELVCTDGNWSYSEVLSSRNIKHLISKSETCLVESYNAILRRYLARLQRKQIVIQKMKKC
jgi:IS1 family transposase